MAAPADRGSIRDDLRRGADEVRGLGDDAGKIGAAIRELLRSEIELAKAEVREQFSLAIRSAIWAGVGAATAMLTLVFVFVTLLFALQVWMPTWVAALIVTALLAGLTAAAGLMVRARLRQITVVPKKTIGSLREDVAWARAQLKSSTA